MVLVIFLSGIAVALALSRQEKIHWLQLEIEYRRAGFEIPKPVPRLSKIEAWLNITVGILLLVAGGWFLLLILNGTDLPRTPSLIPLPSLILAGGATLVILGAKALKLHAAH